ncbi:outer membrane beta-barrel protein, partial [Steroidobacter sp.]|uniref:outer membrane beta-barrel protein n=1 Tax=Steroidobacter sp. TaxID=1978227 RepID=UPI001A534BEF
MKHKRVIAAAIAVAAFAGLPVAQAAQPGFYIGGLYGQGDKQLDIQGFDAYGATVVYPASSVQLTVESKTTSLDKSDAAFGFFAGYRFNTHLAVEAGYIDLG